MTASSGSQAYSPPPPPLPETLSPEVPPPPPPQHSALTVVIPAGHIQVNVPGVVKVNPPVENAPGVPVHAEEFSCANGADPAALESAARPGVPDQVIGEPPGMPLENDDAPVPSSHGQYPAGTSEFGRVPCPDASESVTWLA